MKSSKTKKLISLLALVLCLALATVFVFAFAGCDDTDVGAAEELYKKGDPYVSESGRVSGIYKSTDISGDVNLTSPVTVNSEIVEPVYVEHKNLVRTSEFDENGVAEGLYYFPIWLGCSCDRNDNRQCQGHKVYLTSGGEAYDFYPYSYTLTPIETTAETVGIQLSLVFDHEPTVTGGYFVCEKYNNLNLDGPKYVSVASITGEPLDVTEVYFHRDLNYYCYPDRTFVGCLMLGNINSNQSLVIRNVDYPLDDETETYSILCNVNLQDNCYNVLTVRLGNGDCYQYGTNILGIDTMEIMIECGFSFGQ